MHASTLDAVQWWTNPRGEHATTWIQNYQNSLNTRHRVLISQIVGGLHPGSVLEIGCHCGPNLIKLATDHPTLKCYGLDPSAEAIAAGNQWAQSLELGQRVEMQVGRFPEATDKLPSKSFDVVLSCYAIGAYVAPADLHASLYELGRIARRAVIIAEPMVIGESQARQTMNGYVEWHHDYQKAVAWAPNLNQLPRRVVGVDPPVDALNAILVLGE